MQMKTALNEILDESSITLREDADGLVTIGGRFAVGDSELTERAIQDRAERLLSDLRGDFEQYLKRDAFPDGMSVSHTRVCGGLYDIAAYHQTIEGGLRYYICLGYGTAEGRAVPTFKIATRKSELPKTVPDRVKKYFPISTKRYGDAVEVHNKHLRAYSTNLNARLRNQSP